MRALESVDLSLDVGEILGLIGPNGAGKTTLLNVLSGYQPATAGRVELDGEDITALPVGGRCARGVSRTFQNVRLFGGLDVRENVALGALGSGLAPRAARDLSATLLDRFGLGARKDELASRLSYGEERRLGIARALATRPRFLLLDEPAAGLNETESDELLVVLQEIHREFECALLVVEHDMRLMTRLCPSLQVLEHGETIAVGTPSEIRTHPRVLEAYLGTEEDEDNAAD